MTTKTYDQLLDELDSYNVRTKAATETYEENLVDIATAVTSCNDDADRAEAAVEGIDITSIARSLNVLDSEVIYSTDTVTILDNVLYIYDASAQTTWGKPSSVGAGETIVSVAGDEITTSAGVYTLINHIDINAFNLGSFSTYAAPSAQDMINGVTVGGDTVRLLEGDIWMSGAGVWRKNSNFTGTLFDFDCLNGQNYSDFSESTADLLEDALLESDEMRLGRGDYLVNSQISVDQFRALSSDWNPYRTARNGLRTTDGAVSPLRVKASNLGFHLKNLSIWYDNLDVTTSSAIGLQFSTSGGAVTAGIGQKIEDVYIKGFSTGISQSGYSWQVTYDRVVVESANRGFESFSGSSNITTYSQCIALLGSLDYPLTSIGFRFNGSQNVTMHNCASEANYINFSLLNSNVVFDSLYSESAGFVDFDLDGSTIYGQYLNALPTAARFGSNSIFRAITTALPSRVKIDHMKMSGEINIDNVFSLDVICDIDIGFLETKIPDGGALFTNLWSTSKYAPRHVGMANEFGDRWYLQRSVTDPSSMIPTVELNDFSETFAYNTIMRDDSTKDFKVVGARQITPSGNREWTGSRWRYEKSSEAPKSGQNTSVWVDKSLLAGEFRIYEAVNTGAGDGSCILQDEGAREGDVITVVAAIDELAFTLTVKNITPTVIRTLTNGQRYDFVFTNGEWI